MNDGFLQHMRVGATAALGAKYLARSDAKTRKDPLALGGWLAPLLLASPL